MSYNISISPALNATATMISNTRANLTLAYNTPYNVSVVADFCGHQATTIIEIGVCTYGSYMYFLSVLCMICIVVACGDILKELSGADLQKNVSESIIVVSGLGYSKPSLEGERVKFTCPPKQVLTGPNSTKCMGNEEWEPDPREVTCKGIANANSVL